MNHPTGPEVEPAEAGAELAALAFETGEANLSTPHDVTSGELPQPTPVPDGGVLLDNDFETGAAPGWVVVGAPTKDASAADWSVILGTSGSVFAQGILDANRWHIAYADTPLPADQIIEAKMRVVDFSTPSSSSVAALFGRYDAAADSGYFVALRGDGSLIVRRRDRSANASWAAGVDVGVRAGVWYTVRLEIIGAVINAFLDGTSVYSVTDADPLTGGGLALGTLGATVEVDRVSVATP
jgi:hypothetical protein